MSKKHFNIVLANCAINNGNRGCVALSISAMLLIDELLTRHGISYTFMLPQSGFLDEEEHSYKVNDKNLRYISIVDPDVANIKNAVKRAARFFGKFNSYNSSINKIKQCDFILDIGHGDSFADIYGKCRFDWVNNMYKIGRKYHKPYCILPQTIGPYKDGMIRKEAEKSISLCKCVMTRDKQSYDYLRSLLPDVKVSEIIDVAFYMPYVKKHFDGKYVHVGLNVSALLWHGSYTRDNQFGLKDDYQNVVHSVISTFLKMPNVKVHLVSHVVGCERDLENDYAVSYDLCEEYDNHNLVLAPLFLDPIAAKGYIAGMDFFMGARMHATIGAFSSGVSVVPMAYSRKFNGLFEDTLGYRHMVDLKTDSFDDILKIVSDSFCNREQIKNEISAAMNGVVKERKKLLMSNLEQFFGL